MRSHWAIPVLAAAVLGLSTGPVAARVTGAPDGSIGSCAVSYDGGIGVNVGNTPEPFKIANVFTGFSCTPGSGARFSFRSAAFGCGPSTILARVHVYWPHRLQSTIRVKLSANMDTAAVQGSDTVIRGRYKGDSGMGIGTIYPIDGSCAQNNINGIKLDFTVAI